MMFTEVNSTTQAFFKSLIIDFHVAGMWNKTRGYLEGSFIVIPVSYDVYVVIVNRLKHKKKGVLWIPLNNLNSNVYQFFIKWFSVLNFPVQLSASSVSFQILGFWISQHSASDNLGKKSLVHSLAGSHEIICLYVLYVCVRVWEAGMQRLWPTQLQYTNNTNHPPRTA